MAFAREVLGPNAYKLVKSGKLEMSQRHFYMWFYRFGEVQPVKTTRLRARALFSADSKEFLRTMGQFTMKIGNVKQDFHGY